jgi:hypothetical protein
MLFRAVTAIAAVGALIACANMPKTPDTTSARQECYWHAENGPWTVSLHATVNNADLIRGCDNRWPEAWYSLAPTLLTDGVPAGDTHRCDISVRGVTISVWSSAKPEDVNAAAQFCHANGI